MRCSAVVRLLSRYLDDDLDSATQEAVSRHLSVCSVCAAELSEYQRIRGQLRGLSASFTGSDEDDSAYWTEIKEKMSRPPARIVRLNVWRGALVAAAAVLFLALALIGLRGGRVEDGRVAGGPRTGPAAPRRQVIYSGRALASIGDDSPAATGGLEVAPAGLSGSWDDVPDLPADTNASAKKKDELITF